MKIVIRAKNLDFSLRFRIIYSTMICRKPTMERRYTTYITLRTL